MNLPIIDFSYEWLSNNSDKVKYHTSNIDNAVVGFVEFLTSSTIKGTSDSILQPSTILSAHNDTYYDNDEYQFSETKDASYKYKFIINPCISYYVLSQHMTTEQLAELLNITETITVKNTMSSDDINNLKLTLDSDAYYYAPNSKLIKIIYPTTDTELGYDETIVSLFDNLNDYKISQNDKSGFRNVIGMTNTTKHVTYTTTAIDTSLVPVFNNNNIMYGYSSLNNAKWILTKPFIKVCDMDISQYGYIMGIGVELIE